MEVQLLWHQQILRHLLLQKAMPSSQSAPFCDNPEKSWNTVYNKGLPRSLALSEGILYWLVATDIATLWVPELWDTFWPKAFLASTRYVLKFLYFSLEDPLPKCVLGSLIIILAWVLKGKTTYITLSNCQKPMDPQAHLWQGHLVLRFCLTEPLESHLLKIWVSAELQHHTGWVALRHAICYCKQRKPFSAGGDCNGFRVGNFKYHLWKRLEAWTEVRSIA